VRKCFLFLFLLNVFTSRAQSLESKDSTLNTQGRKWVVGTGLLAGYSGSFIFLNEAWYKDYPRTTFHSYNDGREWLQMDKIGHAWTAYNTSRITSKIWQWAGVPEKKAIMLGTGGSLFYMLSIEYLDGLSTEWGWSWPDVGADLFGAALYSSQQMAWKDQKIQLKFSSHYNQYTGALSDRADELFNTGFYARLLKDYNAQTYWLSFNLKSFLPASNVPKWLNVSIGYGAEGMFGGYENLSYDKDCNLDFYRRDIKRYRQFYLSPDIDLTKINTKSKALKTVFDVFNVLKFPAPALELSNGSLKVKAIAF
jgi:hypothetical protein